MSVDSGVAISYTRDMAKIVAPPRFSWLREWDCTECGHETLRHPVFVDDGSGARAVGSGCAAKLLGLPTKSVTRQRDVALSDAQRAEEVRAERAAKYRQALAQWDEYGAESVGHAMTEPKGPAWIFDMLRRNWAQHHPELLPPAAFADFLSDWLDQNDS